MLDTFLDTVGPGVMKVLLLDRGFINGTQIGRLKRKHSVDTVIPIRSDMDLQDDVRGLMTLSTSWEEYEPTRRSPLPDVTSVARSTATSHGNKARTMRQQTLAKQRAELPATVARAEPCAREDVDRTFPRTHQLVGLSGSTDGRVLARPVRRRA